MPLDNELHKHVWLYMRVTTLFQHAVPSGSPGTEGRLAHPDFPGPADPL